MNLYVSRFSNPELKSGAYTAVRISLGAPRWNVGYPIAGAIKALMPSGLFGKAEFEEYHAFRKAYRDQLNREGMKRIQDAISVFQARGPEVVLLCFEDVRQPGNWCHRTMFAEWWMEKGGGSIEELHDPTPPPQTPYTPKKKPTTQSEQLSLF